MSFPFSQLLINSLIIGSVYGLVAAGFSLIYTTNKVMHFAHGASIAVGGYICFWLFSMLGMPFWLSVILTLIASAALGYLVRTFFYAPLQKKQASSVVILIVSVALLILFENILMILFGAGVKSFQLFEITAGISVLGARITLLQIIIILSSAALLILLYFFLRYTQIGRELRAVADNPELANIQGIQADKLMTAAFLIASVLAGVAGVLIGLEQSLEPTMGTSLMVKGFSGAVIGGMTSVPASIAGSYIVGVAENFGIWWLPSGWKDAITFTLLFLFLLLRPQGLFGKKTGERL
ncbi:MAG: branched-chain amino acid ABC transporter permease [Candidatus Woesearchaeota archaeon]